MVEITDHVQARRGARTMPRPGVERCPQCQAILPQHRANCPTLQQKKDK